MKLVNIANVGRNVYKFIREDDYSLRIEEDNTFYPFFYELDERGKYNTYDGKKARIVFANEPRDIAKMKSLNGSYSSDVHHVKNYLTYKVPTLEETKIKYLFIDIEILAKEMPSADIADKPISCITVYNSFNKEYKTWWLKDYKDSWKSNNDSFLLKDFCAYIKEQSPDIIMGWNFVDFDYRYLHNRIKNFALLISPVNETRRGNDENIFFPVGISIVDYMEWFKKVSLREPSYALNEVCQRHLNDGDFGDSDFGTLNEHVKEKNINDVRRLVNLEEKFKIVKYFDDIRRLSFAQWEELTHNSYIIEMLLLKEAKEMSIVLPNKPKDKKESSFQGAIREAEKTGRLFDIGKYDLTSAYPSAIINFNIDAMNLSDDGLDIGGIKIKQNSEALLPKVVSKLLVLKNNLKKELSIKDYKTEEYKKLETKYSAIKGVINSAFGVIGYPGFRLFNKDIVSSITFLVRNLLDYARKRSNEDGNKVVYWDTDAVFVENKNNIVDKLNGYIKEWANKYNKDSVGISFEFEGIFEKIFILSKCRYIGYIQTKKGLKEEIKGLEIKRSSSSKHEASFQREMFRRLFEKDCTKESIELWIKEEKKRVKTLDLLEVGFPCKLNEYKEYVNEPIFVRAYKNRQLKDKDFKVAGGERYYWIYTNMKDKDDNGKVMNVIAYNAKFPLAKVFVDYDEVIRRNIISKAENIYEAMKWETFSLHDDKMTTLF